MIIAASLKFSEILAATFSATWFGLKSWKDHNIPLYSTYTPRKAHEEAQILPGFLYTLICLIIASNNILVRFAPCINLRKDRH